MITEELSLRRDTFSVKTTRVPGNKLHLQMDGCADLRVQNDIAVLLDRIHKEARNTSVTTVIVNMENLEFLNSGCFKCLCSWVRWMLGGPRSYVVTIISSPKHHWQTRSLSALRQLAPDLISVEVVRDPPPV